MCPITLPAVRKQEIMPMEMFQKIIDSIEPYQENIQMMDLFGLSEPFLDPHIFDRVQYVKEKGFQNVGISTNAHLLNKTNQKRILDSGIDNMILSIDGATKTTHESIRKRTNFDRVVANCESLIKMRNDGNYNTKFVVRFIRQNSNKHEWEAYKEFWKSRIMRDKGDFITLFDAHTHGGEVFTQEGHLEERFRDPVIDKKACYLIFDVLYILADGTVPLCSEDWYKASYNFGNINNQSPIEIFNNSKFNKIRKLHTAGKKTQLAKCRDCTVHYSVVTKEVVQ